MNKVLLKLTVLVGVVSAAASANAWVLNLGGSYTGGTSPALLTANWGNSNLFPGGFYWTLSGGFSPTTNYGFQSFTDGTNNLDFNFTGSNYYIGGTQIWTGSWTATSINGLNTASTGSYTFVFDGVSSWSETVAGQPAPEPASIGLLGIGLFGLVRRRKKA